MDETWKSALEAWLAPFVSALRHKTRGRMCPAYIAGLIVAGDRKSVQPMAARDSGVGYDQLHHFIASGAWDAAPLEKALLAEADRMVGGDDAWLIVDDTALPKKGQHSVGVAPQYASSLGKTANCQSMVSLTLASREVPVMVGLRLFLPESWTSDPERMARARVPEDRRTARTKPEIAIREIDRVIACGVRFGCVLADSGYGSSGTFRQALSERGLKWAVGLSKRQNVYCVSAWNFGSDSILMMLRGRSGLVRTGISAMLSFHASNLLPPGFAAVEVASNDDRTIVTIRGTSAISACPSCGAVSLRIHSRYDRRLTDLPMAGRRVVLMLQARRFRCDAVQCARRIFTERFDDNILKPWARRTARLDQIVHCLALALGGRPAASFARRLSMPISNDTLLRAVRRRGSPRFPPPSVIGIDDWAWRRNQRYGTLICDLERRRTIALLPDREPATAQAWFAAQPQIGIVARDRGGGYGLAAQKALPNAVQVADRWHLMENASQAFLDAVRKSMRDIRAAVGAATINPELLTSAEKLQYEGFKRREETNAAILAMSKEGATIKQIVRRASYSRGLVRKVLRGQRSDIFRVRSSSLEAYLPWLDEQWAAGRRNGSELWRALKSQGFRGCLRVVSEWSGRRRRSEKMDASALGRAPSARTVARLMTLGRDQLSKAETVTVAVIEGGVERLVHAREAVAAFQNMIRRKTLAELGPWIENAKTTLVASFANGVTKDIAAVSAAISSGWSNGQTEGQICKLKLVKRQMYGRGKLDLLQARVIGFG